jgi:hypothetical protein
MNRNRLGLVIRTSCAPGAGVVGWCALVSIAIVAGCTEPRGPLSVKSEDPTLKIPAIKQDVRQHDTSDVAQMVKDLDNDDPAVRFYAIEGLRRLTGDSFGYRYYDDEDERRPALKRWKDWLKQRGGS